MIIKKVSLFTGKINSMDLPISEEQIKRFDSGELVQKVFPELTPDQREFLLTGTTQVEWSAAFADDDRS